MHNFIRNIKTLSTLSLLTALALTFGACSDDSDYHKEAKQTTLHLRTSSQNYGFTPLLRSVTSGYSAYSGIGTNCDIIMYMTQGTPKTNMVYETTLFKWDKTNEWTANVALETGDTYYVYGYMPANAATGTISSTDYTTGSTIILSNLNTVSTQDVCVITGAAAEDYPTHPFDIINSTTPVVPGVFSITAKDGDNYLYVLMNHIYAKLGLHFKVEGPSSYYYSLRGIRLKKVEMSTTIGELTVNVHSGSANPTLSYNEETGTTQTITLFDVNADDDDSNDAGIEITPTGIEVPAFFTPMQSGDSKHLKFVSYYDVYYRDTDGNITETLVRSNCTATNEWTLSPQSGQEFGSGKQITISATIIPTYLYQLADPDLVNPTIKIEN